MSICGTITLNPRELAVAQMGLAQLPGLPCAQAEPVFAGYGPLGNVTLRFV
jgi:hypothetical protein